MRVLWWLHASCVNLVLQPPRVHVVYDVCVRVIYEAINDHPVHYPVLYTSCCTVH